MSDRTPDDLSAMRESVVMNPDAVGNPNDDPRVFVGANLRELLRPCACGGVNGFHSDECNQDSRCDGECHEQNRDDCPRCGSLSVDLMCVDCLAYAAEDAG